METEVPRYGLTMTRIRMTRSVSALLKGADALLVVAPKARFEDGSFLDCLPEALMRLALDLASDLDPGRNGLAADPAMTPVELCTLLPWQWRR